MNRTTSPRDLDDLLGRAARRGHRPFVVGARSGRTTSILYWDEVSAAVEAAAARAARLRGCHVLLRAGAGPAWIIAFLGLLRTGAVPVLLPLSAPAGRVSQVREMLLTWDAPHAPHACLPCVVLCTTDYTEAPLRVPLERLWRSAWALQAQAPLKPSDRVCVGADLSAVPALSLLMQVMAAGASLGVTADVLPRRLDIQALRPTCLLVPRAWLENRRLVLMRMLHDLPLGIGRLLSWSLREAPGGLTRSIGTAIRAPLVARVRRRLGPALRLHIVADEFVDRPTRSLLAALGSPVLEIVTSPAWGGGFATRACSMEDDARDGFTLLPGARGTTDETGEVQLAWDDEPEIASNWLGEISGHTLRLCGRARDVVVLAGGEPRHPVRAERFLVADEVVERAVICGNGLAAPVAIIVPRREALMAWAAEHHVEVNDDDAGYLALLAHPSCQAWIGARLEAAQQTIPPSRRIREHRLVPDDPLLHEGPGRAWRRRVEQRYGDAGEHQVGGAEAAATL